MDGVKLVIVVGVEMVGQAHLMLVAHALDAQGFRLGSRQRGQQQTRQDGNDRDHNQQFDQSKSGSSAGIHAFWPGQKTVDSVFSQPPEARDPDIPWASFFCALPNNDGEAQTTILDPHVSGDAAQGTFGAIANSGGRLSQLIFIC